MSSIMSSLARRSLSRIPRIPRTKPHCCTPLCSCFHSSSSPISKITSSSLKTLSTTQSHFNLSRFSSSSTSALKKPQADAKLSLVLQSEIDCAKEEQEDLDQGGLVPDGFPFEIVDNPGEDTITLKREFEGENIEVLVEMQHSGEEENADEDDDDKDEDDASDKDALPFNLSLVVSIAKGDGPRLEFTCSATQRAFTIDAMLMKESQEPSNEHDFPYEGPDFLDLDENLQKEFYKYLERRGIKHSSTTFLQEYMVDKESKEYMQWLNSMKEFVDK
ncbi:hypothetical protein ACHQM5_000398 [Ranunculus cassubicifolius]